MSTEIHIGEVLVNSIPSEAGETQRELLSRLSALGIDYRVAECEAAVSIDDCETIGRALDAQLVKTLFVANRQLTRFHLVSMPGHKPFVTRQFTRGRGVSRVSFVAPEIMMRMLRTPVGGAGPLSLSADCQDHLVEMVIDEELNHYNWVALPVMTPEMYVAIRMEDLYTQFLPAVSHIPQVISMTEPA